MEKERCLGCLMWEPLSYCVIWDYEWKVSVIPKLLPKKLERQERKKPSDHYQMQCWDLTYIAGIKTIQRCCRKSPHSNRNPICIVFNSKTPTDFEGTISEPYFIACGDESSSLNQFLCISVFDLKSSYTTLWNSKIQYLLCKWQCKATHCKSNLHEMFSFARICSSHQFGVLRVTQQFSRFMASLKTVMTYPCTPWLSVQHLGPCPILDKQVIHKVIQNPF